MPPPTVSLIICSYNRPMRLHATIQMALAQTYAAFEIIVVDQTATNPPDLQTYFDAAPSERVRYYKRTEANLPAARNYGVAQAHGDLIIYIDDDVRLPPDFIQQHVAAHQRVATTGEIPLGGVSGAPLSPRYPTWEQLVAQWGARGETQGLQRGEVVTVPWLTGCNMSFRRETLTAVGGFDPYFTGSGWGEDVDISLTLRAAGYRVVLDTNIALFHELAMEGGGESRAAHRQHTRYYERTGFWLYLLYKHWRTLGVTDSIRRGWRLYREYAGSLALYRRDGMGFVVQRHREFIRLWWAAAHAARPQK